MYPFFHYFNIFIAPVFCLYSIGKGPGYTIAAFLLVLAGNPIFDTIIHKYLNHLYPKLDKADSYKDINYDIPLYLTVPMQLLLVFWAFKFGTFSYAEALLAGSLCGLSGGIIGIAAGHELTHRSNKLEKFYGMILLYTINYPHFYLEHMWHHLAVGTEKDADTAFRGETLYQFLPRAIVDGWLTCWKWEADKLKRKNKSAFSLKNKMLVTTSIQVAIMAAITIVGGGKFLALYVAQGVVTLFLLKWINYVEHYGLVRKVINGRLEPVSEMHSWDSTRVLTNFSLFNLGFHTSHHVNPRIEYHELPLAQENWNELPAGYTCMMILALVPAAYIQVMEEPLNKLQNVRSLKELGEFNYAG